MTNYHTPVLLNEVINLLKPKKGKLFIDGTLGGGGHTQALLDAGAKVIGLDRDPEAIKFCKVRFKDNKNLKLMHGNFARLDECLIKDFASKKVDGILLDLGVSSHQINEADRGFSFTQDGPLDMRMNPGISATAKGIINRVEEEKLVEIFSQFGEERYSKTIARAIIYARKKSRIETTAQLAEIIKNAIPTKNFSHARSSQARVFQALRIAVNLELENLKNSIPKAFSILKKKGRLVVLSYHSLEDRIVKDYFKM